MNSTAYMQNILIVKWVAEMHSFGITRLLFYFQIKTFNALKAIFDDYHITSAS